MLVCSFFFGKTGDAFHPRALALFVRSSQTQYVACGRCARGIVRAYRPRSLRWNLPCGCVGGIALWPCAASGGGSDATPRISWRTAEAIAAFRVCVLTCPRIGRAPGCATTRSATRSVQLNATLVQSDLCSFMTAAVPEMHAAANGIHTKLCAAALLAMALPSPSGRLCRRALA